MGVNFFELRIIAFKPALWRPRGRPFNHKTTKHRLYIGSYSKTETVKSQFVTTRHNTKWYNSSSKLSPLKNLPHKSSLKMIPCFIIPGRSKKDDEHARGGQLEYCWIQCECFSEQLWLRLFVIIIMS